MRVFALGFALILAPLLTGLLPVRFMDREKRSLGVTYLAGFLEMLAIFQLITIPILLTEDWGFLKVVPYYTIAMVIASTVGIAAGWSMRKELAKALRAGKAILTHKNAWKAALMPYGTETFLYWLLVIGLIGFQMIMSYTHMSFDGDDAFYVVESVLAVETNTLYRVLPYTGLSTALDIRHALAPLPIWEAWLAEISGIHPTIIAHSLLQLILFPLAYLVFYEIGKCLFRKEKDKLPVYMIFIVLLQLFGNVSIYTNATFFLMRTWQGKAVLAAIILPAILWILLLLLDEGRQNRKGLWFLLVCANMTAALSTTMGVFLTALMIAVTGLAAAIVKKQPLLLVKLALTCIPCVVYAALFWKLGYYLL